MPYVLKEIFSNGLTFTIIVITALVVMIWLVALINIFIPPGTYKIDCKPHDGSKRRTGAKKKRRPRSSKGRTADL